MSTERKWDGAACSDHESPEEEFSDVGELKVKGHPKG